MNPLIKDILREIKNTKGRFFSILLIVLIGVAFFAGVWAAPQDMLYSADKYYDDNNLLDVEIVGNYGITEDDVDAIAEIDGIEGLYPSYTADFIGSDQKVIRVSSFNLNNFDSQDYINQFVLVEGSLPTNSQECVVGYNRLTPDDVAVGDYISLVDPDDNLSRLTYKVVGLIDTPYYLSYQIGNSELGRGIVDKYMYIADTNFTMDYYTEVYATIADAKAYNSYNDDYFDFIEPVTTALESLGSERSEIRYDSIQEEAQSELASNQQLYDDNLAEYNEKISQAEDEIADGKDEIILGKAQIASARMVLEANIASSKAQISAIQEQIDDLQQQAIDAKASYETQQVVAENQKKELEAANDELEAKQVLLLDNYNDISTQIADLNQRNEDLALELAEKQIELNDYDESSVEYIELSEEIANINQQIADNNAELALLVIDDDYLAYQENQQQIDLNKQQIALIDTGITQADESFSLIDQQIASANDALAEQEASLVELETTQTAEIDANEKELLASEKELEAAKVTLENEKATGQEKLDDAKQQLLKAEKDISLLTNVKWYILDRNSQYSYVDYGQTADKMKAIAKVFPVFFLLVAALVTLTTMTRLIDEKRLEIGTLKALGYKESTIIKKYLIYGISATVIGGCLGLALGMVVFPTVIYNAWKMMYVLPKIAFETQIPLMLTTLLAAIIVTAVTTIIACYQQLVEKPSSLMRPKPLKVGKTIILEKIGFIWKHLSFTSKVTARNIFRYKKKMAMTIIGIAGCSALLIAGFGISDSISDLVHLQFVEIYKYDSIITLDDSLLQSEKEDFTTNLIDDVNVSKATLVDIESAKIIQNNDDTDIQLIVTKDEANFSDFISLRNRVSQENFNLNSKGVIITEKLARSLDVIVDDKITLENEDGYQTQVSIVGISENYIGNFVYMTNTLFTDSYDLQPVYNTVLANSLVSDDELAALLEQNDQVVSTVFYSSIIDTFSDTVESLNIIVFVLVVSAGCLAFVVLYNLTNVNIAERKREIATLKVLGFRDKEVNSYVYRENMLLTLIGTLCGLLLGKGLHLLIMVVVETSDMMYGRNINLLSYIISFGLTMSFAMIVNFVMAYKLKAIKMVESLKSVE